jgi:tetratricopeptide (TPR) repeat protein
MSKKKSKKNPTQSSKARPAETKATAAPNKKRSLFLISGIIVVAMVAGFFFLRKNQNASTEKNDVVQPPQVDLSSAETEVATKVEKLRNEVIQNPQSSEAWGKLGMNLDVHDFKQQAIVCYQQAASMEPQNFNWPYYCAIAFSDLGSSESLNWYERSIKIRNDYAPLYVRYGNALFDSGRLEDSSKAYQRAVEINPLTVYALIGQARIQLARNDLQECETYLNQALAINQNIAEIHGLLSELYRRRNEIVKSEQETRLANLLPKKTPLSDTVYSNLALEGVSSTWYETRGRAYLESGMYADAERELRAALKVRPEFRIYDALGLALQNEGKMEEAIQQHRRALELNSSNAIAWNNLASALFATGKTKEAIESAEQGRMQDPSLAFSYVNLGRFYEASGNVEQAISTYEEGLKRNPGNVRLQQNLARLKPR